MTDDANATRAGKRGGARSTTRHGNGGWGGPAKGAGASMADKAPPFDFGNVLAAGPHDMTGAQKAQQLKEHLFKLATMAEREETQVRAAEAWLNRHEGTPVQRNINVSADDLSALSDDALAARQAELERALRQGAGSAPEAAHPSGPSRLVN